MEELEIGDASKAGKRPRAAIGRLIERLRHEDRVPVLGVGGGARGWLGAHVYRALGRPLLAVAEDEEQADRLAGDLAFFLGASGQVLRVPTDDLLPYAGLSPDRGTEMDRLAALARLREGAAAVVISARGLPRRMVPAATIERQRLRLEVGGTLDRDELARRLVEVGYQNVPLVEDPGTFAVRGAILDVWSPAYEQPLRLELFGDEVESLRLFDPANQRTVQALEEAVLVPVREVPLTEEGRRRGVRAVREAADRSNRPTADLRPLVEAIQGGSWTFGVEALLPAFHEGGLVPLTEHLPPEAVVLLDDPIAIERRIEGLWDELLQEYEAAVARGDLVVEPEAHFLRPEELRTGWEAFSRVELHRLWLGGPGAKQPLRFDLPATADLRKAMQEKAEDGALGVLAERLERWRERGLVAVLACGSAGQADRLARLLRGRDLRVEVHEGPLPPEPTELWRHKVHAHLFRGELSGGFLAPENALAVLSDEEILGARQVRRSRARRRPDLPSIAAFRDLKEGDLCVHVEHGLCRYGGLEKLNVRGIEADFLVLHFAGADKLYLPVWRLRQIQKYVGGGAEHVRLDRLGGSSWEKTKKRVKDELLEMAAELLRIYAQRKAHPGIRFPEPDALYEQFEAAFPYEETPDQARAISEVIADMTSERPMDRLICGDVGFGKTEVAMRAAFLAVLGGKQVVVLVPTTILALQHFRSFSERMRGYAVRVDWVSSLRSARENREVLRKAAEGSVDIVIGTHALLGSSVSFRDPGLLIIDEEQKFGVSHKEKIKKLRGEIDVLTLSATPIPRTLHMSMAGMRDMSIIQTPPVDRRSIRTFVSRFSPQEIREAIERERARGGQVFFVHNRVETLDKVYRFLKDLVPEARIAVAHGQMAERDLERVIGDFIEQKYDVLLCTTIIESGIDMPRANTILIDRADTFGLAQLYQLRGRVGRSSERAYAYLLVPPEQQMSKEAQQRLEVIQELTELGAGFQIATHDLEIRGAGNLLGAKQSGQIEAVGFDLYVELLEEAVAELKGEPLRRKVEPEVQLPVPAFLPDAWLPDVHQRLLFYKKLSQAEDEEEIEEIREEMIDRCGPPPPEVDRLCRVMAIKAELASMSLRALEAGPARLVVVLGPDAELDGAKLMKLVAESGGSYRLTPELKLIARTEPGLEGERLFAAVEKVLRDLRACRP